VAALREFRSLPAAEMVNRIYESVRAFSGDMPQSDDLTMVALRTLG